jgi:hypothetical protein
MVWATFWANFSQSHLVTLIAKQKSGGNEFEPYFHAAKERRPVFNFGVRLDPRGQLW